MLHPGNKYYHYLAQILLIIIFAFPCHSEQKVPLGKESCLSRDTVIRKLINEEIVLEDSGFWKKAIDKNFEILKRCPDNVFSLNTLAGLYGKISDFETEITWAQKVISINPEYTGAYINYGNALASLGKIDKAISMFEKACTLDPTSPLGVYSLGVVEEQRGNYTKAVEYYLKAVRLDDEFENGFFNLGIVYANLEKYDDAIKAFSNVLVLNPAALGAREMLRQIEKRRGK